MGFAEVFGLTANTVRLCGLGRSASRLRLMTNSNFFGCKTAITVFA